MQRCNSQLWNPELEFALGYVTANSVCLAGQQPQGEQCLLATQSGADDASGNKVLAVILMRVTAAKGS